MKKKLRCKKELTKKSEAILMVQKKCDSINENTRKERSSLYLSIYIY